MSNTLGAGIVRIHLDTRSELSARMAGQLLSSFGEALAAHFGPDAQVHFESAGRGTWWAQVMVIVGGLTMTAGGTVLAAQALAKEIREGGTPFSRSVPAALDEGDGRTCTISGVDEEIAIAVDEMPAYPPPVGEDRALWSMGSNVRAARPGEPVDWATSSTNDGPAGNAERGDLGDLPAENEMAYLTDENGNYVTDEKGNRLVLEGVEPATRGRRPDAWLLDVVEGENRDSEADVVLPPTISTSPAKRRTVTGEVSRYSSDLEVSAADGVYVVKGLVTKLDLKPGDRIRLHGIVDEYQIFPESITLIE